MALAPRRSKGVVAAVGFCLGLLCLTAQLASTFLVPTSASQAGQGTQLNRLAGSAAPGLLGLAALEDSARPHQNDSRTALSAVGVGAKVLAAMSAGLVASVVSALLAAVTEPVMNRVLVKRMSVKDAMSEMSPKIILGFFTTTMSTNLLKFPLFEAVSMFLSLLPNMTNVLRGLLVGFIFTTATLPITNFRYRMSVQTPVAEALKPSSLYQAYLPTVVRDMVYAIGRNTLTALMLARFTGLSASSPSLMFPVVIGACVLSAPFNEIRGFLLQAGSKKLSFQEFFKPVNFLRSTSLGALNMGVSVATGYFLTPIVGRAVSRFHASFDAGSPAALLGVVLFLDGMGWVVAQGFSKKVFTRRIDVNKDNIIANTEDISALMERMEALEAANKRLSDKVVSLGGTPDDA
eukprot:TRINITY_DN34752_c0_g1_i1.p1 TRINITY_DN34752_c0_g1~~TRINITY_DN34752_c0_g1_i1.p1  ORF type:complete len:447 (-),score=89.97 TRINITY_DN34752_c0_g1_i1:63-1277(-)